MRANDALAVVVPAGSHQVDFKFLPRTTIIGFVISATTFLTYSRFDRYYDYTEAVIHTKTGYQL